jgi:hypothetical protein
VTLAATLSFTLEDILLNRTDGAKGTIKSAVKGRVITEEIVLAVI